ncbi:MAG: hypothetical protein ACI854_000126 [Arenicella sp.]|jgi:hypothetical protein
MPIVEQIFMGIRCYLSDRHAQKKPAPVFLGRLYFRFRFKIVDVCYFNPESSVTYWANFLLNWY